MTKPALETLKYNENENFWPFHETFLNHAKNMGWNKIVTYNIGGTNKDLATQFGEDPINNIKIF